MKTVKCEGSCQQELTVEELCMDVERYMVHTFENQDGYTNWIKQNPAQSAYLAEVDGGGWEPWCGKESCTM